MSDEIMLVFGEDGVAKKYDDTWDITIHCESEEEQKAVLKKLNNSNQEPQDSPKPTAESVQNVQNEDLISRKAAIDAECEVCQIAPKKESGHNCTYYVHGCKEIECLRALPSAQPEIVRCGQCKYAEVADAQDNQDGYTCQFHRGSIWFSGSYCSWGERRTDERSD